MSIRSGTVLVTMELDGKLYFAADKRISWGAGKAAVSPAKKVAKRNGVLMSGTGHASIIFDIIHRSKFPKFKNQKPDAYIHHQFLPAIIGDLRYKGIVDSRERRLVSGRDKSDYSPSVVILVGLKKGKSTYVYEMDLNSDCITIDAVPSDYTHGCGGDYAMGVITFLKEKDRYKVLKLTPAMMLQSAISVAAFHSPGCDAHCDTEIL